MKPHRLDPVSLAFGLVFLGAAGTWVAGYVLTLRPATIGWIVAAGLMVLGGLGLARTLAGVSTRRDRDQAP